MARGAWQDALAIFQAALAQQETPETLEGLGMAAYWLGDAATTIESRERAYVLYRERGDMRAAGRIATFLSLDYIDFRGEIFVADGWLQRAHHLLEGLAPCPEQGWLSLYEGHFALITENDTDAALARSAQAAAMARNLGLFDLEMLALALEGLALVHTGSVAEGMRKIDEAATAALLGEMQDLTAIGVTCCTLIFACEAVRDYDRAAQWCKRVEEFARRWRTLPLLAICRNYYASVLMWRGDWNQAEEELRLATRGLAENRPPAAMEAASKLAELRRRRGDLEEAERLLAQANEHPLSLLVRAAIAFDRGDNTSAASLAERFLRRIFPDDPALRMSALELLVRSKIASDDMDAARQFLEEAKSALSATATMPLQSTVATIEGLLAVANGNNSQARQRLEDAVDFYRRSGAPYETARARADLAGVLMSTGRQEEAAKELQAALAAFEKLSALTDAGRARMLLSELGQPVEVSGATATPLASGLTARELEVLRLIAQGRSNREMAQQLFLSVRTVERHITNIYGKIDARNKADATAFALRSGIA